MLATMLSRTPGNWRFLTISCRLFVRWCNICFHEKKIGSGLLFSAVNLVIDVCNVFVYLFCFLELYCQLVNVRFICLKMIRILHQNKTGFELDQFAFGNCCNYPRMPSPLFHPCSLWFRSILCTVILQGWCQNWLAAVWFYVFIPRANSQFPAFFDLFNSLSLQCSTIVAYVKW